MVQSSNPAAPLPPLTRSPRFRRFWFGRFLANTAQNAILLALLITVVNRTGSTIHSSLLVLTFVIPAALLGVIGGVAVDHLPMRAVLTLSCLLRALLCVAFLRSNESVWVIYGVNLALSAVVQFSNPAESALVPRITPPQQIAAATSLLFAGVIAAQVAGTLILGPLFVKTIGPDPLFFTCIVLFLGAAVCYSLVGSTPFSAEVAARRSEKPYHGLRGSLSESWRLMRSDRAVFLSAIQQTLITTTVVVLISILPSYTHRALHLPPENAVFVFLPAALGVALGYWLVPRFVRTRGKSTIAWAGFLIFVASLTFLGFSTPIIAQMRDHGALGPLGQAAPGFAYSPAVFCALVAGPMGFGYALVLVAARLVTYERVPEQMQGRIFAFQGVFSSIASIVPLIIAGALSALVGPRLVLGLLAAADIIAVYYARSTLPRRPAGMTLTALRGPAAGS